MALNITPVTDNIYSANLSGSYNERSIFGGNILGQSVYSAYKHVPKDMFIHSLNMYFIAKGNPKNPVNFNVNTLMEGRSYHKKQVNVEQDGKTLATVQISFKVNENTESFVFAPKMPDVVHHSELKFDEEYSDMIKEHPNFTPILSQRIEHMKYWMKDMPILTKHVNHEISMLLKKNEASIYQKWMKVDTEKLLARELPISDHVILAFISDMGMLTPVITMYPDQEIGFLVSLDHAMWFRRIDKPVDLNQWLLFESECIYASNSTTINSGKIWTEDGELLVTIMQEGVIRPALKN